MNKLRYISTDLRELCFDDGKMAFISGPRQVGKTTFAKALLEQRGGGNYFNWDEVKFRRIWTKDPALVLPSNLSDTKPLVVLDEIHKARYWKRNLKGLYDTLPIPCDLLVTGSAKLDVYRRGSDSLLGRYHNFRLHPFSLKELRNAGEFEVVLPEELADNIINQPYVAHKEDAELLLQLFEFGGFPEPIFLQSKRKLNLWQKSRIERLIREDLRDISRIPELSQVEMLASLLPERVASSLSMTSLSEDLEVAFNTVKRWINYLKSLFYIYEIKPYSSSLPRSIRKEGKVYLWDWSEVEGKGERFENVVASHLLKYVHFLNDTGRGNYELHYIRNKEKKEIDFLITKSGEPCLPIEVKFGDKYPSKNWHSFMGKLKCKTAVQLVFESSVFKVTDYDSWRLIIMSADSFFQYLV